MSWVMINVSEALDYDTCTRVVVERTLPGAYIDGLYVEGSKTNFKSLASPQQPTPKQLEILPMGERDKNIMLFICNKRVRTTDDKKGTLADVIIWDNQRWRVIRLANWSSFGHVLAYGALEQ